ARVQLFYEDSPGLAAQRFRALLDEHDGEHAAARYGLALALIRGGQHDATVEHLDALLEQHPDNIAVQLAQVEMDSSQNRLDNALSRLDQLLSVRPDNYPLLEARANILLRLRDY